MGNSFKGNETPNKSIVQRYPTIAKSKPKQPLQEESSSQKYHFGKLKSYWVVAATEAIRMARNVTDH